MSHHHRTTFKVDGRLVRISKNTHSGKVGQITVFVLDDDLSAPDWAVAAIDLPEWFYYRGGIIRTGGHTIEISRDGRLHR